MRNFGLIGKSLSHSFSPSYFNEKFVSLGLKNVTYHATEISSIDKIEDIFKKEIDGFNVTIPYKEEIIAYLSQLDEAAEKIGAVNCVKKVACGYKGYNTDWIGFKDSLIKSLDKNTTYEALVLGYGGASKAVCYALEKMNIPFLIVSRKSGFLAYEDLNVEMVRSHLLIINTTSLGMYPHIEKKPDIDYDGLSDCHILYDVIYNPEKTNFLIEGEKRNATVKNGYEMLVLQAEESWKIWNSKED